ncbi:MAG: hypothetical protein MJZ20_07900 [Bacteroidaceae bacterium]|nr:hypothetical protein [Bacteroidaceae bacterium]
MVEKLKEIVTVFCKRIKEDFIKVFQNKKTMYFNMLVELLHYAIIHNDKSKIDELFCFFAGELKSFAHDNGKPNEGIVFPEEYYNFIIETNNLVTDSQFDYIFYSEKDNTYNLPLQYLFIEEEKFLSKESYNVLWKCLMRYIVRNRFDLFYSYWNFVHQYNEHLWEGQPLLYRFNECVCASLMSKKQYEVLYNIIYWFYDDQGKKKPLFSFNHRRMFERPSKVDLIISNDKEEILLRYLNFLEFMKGASYTIPNTSATKLMRNPILEYGKRFFALLYLLAVHNEVAYFQISEEQDLDLPSSLSIDEIKRQIDEFDKTLAIVLQENEIREKFSILWQKDDIQKISAKSIVESIQENFKFHNRLEDIDKEQTQKIDEYIRKGVKEAKDEIQQKMHIVENQSKRSIQIVEKMCSTHGLLEKSSMCDNSLKKLSDKDYKQISGNCYCSLVDAALKPFESISRKTSYASDDDLLKVLDDTIKKYKKKDKYILIVDCSYGEHLFEGKTKQEEGKLEYQGIELHIVPIIRANNTTCNVWLIRKTELPFINFTAEEPQDIYGYRYTQINETPNIYRILLDIGRTPNDILREIRKDLQNYLATGQKVEDLVLRGAAISIESGYYTKSQALCFERVDLPTNADDSYPNDYDYDDFDPPEDPLAEAIITPEEHNKISKQEEIKLLNE